MHPAKDLGTKIVRSAHLPDSDIEIHTKQLESTVIVYSVTATLGSHTETQVYGFGVDGTNPQQPAPKSAADLQAALDAHRMKVADNVAWHAAMEAATAQVK